MTLNKADTKRAADIRREVAVAKKLRKVPPIIPHLATALQTPSPVWGARPVEKQQLQSRLMTLPAELRNLIYTYTVASKPTAIISPKDSWDTWNYLNFMLVCRKLCREIQPIFFEENTLCITDEALFPKYIKQLRQAMDVSGQNISIVSIERRLERCLNAVPVSVYISFVVRKGAADLQLVPTEDSDPGDTVDEKESHTRDSDGESAGESDNENDENLGDMDSETAGPLEWEEWRSHGLALPLKAAEDGWGDEFRHRISHLAGKKEICECRVKRIATQSKNDVMEFVEQFANELSDPALLAIKIPPISPAAGRLTTEMWCCESCNTYRSRLSGGTKALEGDLASIVRRVYAR